MALSGRHQRFLIIDRRFRWFQLAPNGAIAWRCPSASGAALGRVEPAWICPRPGFPCRFTCLIVSAIVARHARRKALLPRGPASADALVRALGASRTRAGARASSGAAARVGAPPGRGRACVPAFDLRGGGDACGRDACQAGFANASRGGIAEPTRPLLARCRPPVRGGMLPIHRSAAPDRLAPDHRIECGG
jgi:hypothetical protein